jgi:hypothetical protein
MVSDKSKEEITQNPQHPWYNGSQFKVNTLAAIHTLKGRQIDLTKAFPQAKLKGKKGFEHKHDEWASDLVSNNQHQIRVSLCRKT